MSLLSALPAPETAIGRREPVPYSSAFAVSELATASFAAVGQELARFLTKPSTCRLLRA